MVRLTRWLTGWVEFVILGKKKGQAERFLSLCARSGFWFWGMSPYQGECSFRCRVRASEYTALKDLARKSGVRLRVIRRKGMPFFFWKLGRRKGLIAGAVLGMILLWLLSSRYWIITVSGNEQLPQQTLLSAAEEEGLFEGAVRDRIDAQNLAAELMERFPEIGWVSVNTKMCSAEICIGEGIPKPQEQSSETPANVLASVDGQILSIDAFDGEAVVREGDAVTKGQLLISGIVEDQQGGTHAVYARGNVVAKTRRTFTAQIPLKQQKVEETGNTLLRKSISVFGIRLPLTLREEPSGLWKQEQQEVSVQLLETPLPLSVTTEIWTEYRETVQYLTQKEAEKLAWDAVTLQQRTLLGDTGCVLQQEIEQSIKNGCFTLSVRAQCQEEIGYTQEILFE